MNTQDPSDALRDLTRRAGIKRILSALGDDAELHLVGGCVRDALLGITVEDIDCTSKLHPAEIRSRLEANGIHTVPTGLKHQTVTAVPFEGEAGIEITTFRGPGMTPEGGLVPSESIEEDLRYRDFTINALAWNLQRHSFVCYPGAMEDLRNKKILCPGDPHERFAEDPLRIMRMIRFGVKSGFSIDEKTFAAAAAAVPALSGVSIERIRDEFMKTLLGEEPARGFEWYVELGILALLFPELTPMVGFEQNEFHAYDVFVHTLEVVKKTPAELVIRLAALLHDIAKPASLTVDEDGHRHFFKHEIIGAKMSRDFMLRLRFSHAITDAVCALVETHMRPIEAGPGGLRRLLRDTGDFYPEWRILKEADASSCKLDESELRLRLERFDEAIEEVKKGPQVSPLKSLAVDGNDLLAFGFRPGPLIGELLRGLHEKVLDEPALNTREQLLELLPKVQEQIERARNTHES